MSQYRSTQSQYDQPGGRIFSEFEYNFVLRQRDETTAKLAVARVENANQKAEMTAKLEVARQETAYQRNEVTAKLQEIANLRKQVFELAKLKPPRLPRKSPSPEDPDFWSVSSPAEIERSRSESIEFLLKNASTCLGATLGTSENHDPVYCSPALMYGGKDAGNVGRFLDFAGKPDVPVDFDAITTEKLLLLMFGKAEVNVADLFPLWRLFHDLELYRFSFLIATAVLRADLGALRFLATQMRDCGFRLDPDSENGDLEMFPEAVVRRLKELPEWKRESQFVDLLYETRLLHFALKDDCPFMTRPFQEHPRIREQSPLCVTGRDILAHTCRSLYETRHFSDVTLTTDDGGKEPVHYVILVLNSSFFRKMFSFPGTEFGQSMEHEPISLESTSHLQLSAYLCWIYTRCLLPEIKESLSALLRLHSKALFWMEPGLVKRIQSELSYQIMQQKANDVFVSLLENRDVLSELDEKHQAWFAELFRSRLKYSRFRGEDLVDVICSIGVDSTSDGSDEKEAQVVFPS